MSMTKTIEIDGKQVPFKASAAIPRIYRVKYGRDIFKDLMKLEKALETFHIRAEKKVCVDCGASTGGYLREHCLSDGKARGPIPAGYGGGLAG